MKFAPDMAGMPPIRADGHIGLVVTSDDEYEELVHPLLTEGARSGQKPVVFGSNHRPVGEDVFLNSRSIDTGVSNELRHEMTIAHREGYRGVRVVANMHQLGALPLTTQELLAFELQVDRAVTRLGATMVCTYHSQLFAPSAVAAAMSAHPYELGTHTDDLGFRMWSSGENDWQICGEIDRKNANTFRTALTSAATATPALRLTFVDLRFIDLAGVQAIAEVVDAVPGLRLTLETRSDSFRRCWQMLGHDECCRRVKIVP